MQTQVEHSGIKWLDISDPDKAKLEKLGEELGFHHLDLEDVFSDTQRSKLDEYSDYLFLVLHLPSLNKETNRVEYLELDVFLLDGQLITIHDEALEVQSILEKVQRDSLLKESFFNKDSSFLLYKILDQLFDFSFLLLDDLNRTLNRVETDVFEYDLHQDNLKEILLLKKDIIHFRRIIIPQRLVIAKLEHIVMSELKIYFDDLVDKIEKIWSMLETMKELVESLHDTNETIISHNTNNVMKVLTVFSAVMLPLTLITGFYGMNLHLPYASNSHAAIFLAGGMLSLVVLMLAYMKHKKWI